jgi:hypothetical protein
MTVAAISGQFNWKRTRRLTAGARPDLAAAATLKVTLRSPTLAL